MINELPPIPPGTLLHPTGSRVICDPPPEDTDYDVPVLEGANPLRLDSGWVREGDDGYGYGATNFTSYRRGKVNLLVTWDAEFFDRFKAATHVAKRLNLLRKSDRIALFQAVLYGNCWTEPEGTNRDTTSGNVPEHGPDVPVVVEVAGSAP